MDIQPLRKTLRARRRDLTPPVLQAHSLLMARQAMTYRPLQQARRIAFYLATDGEMDPAPLLAHAQACGKRCFLPVLRERPGTGLWFAEYRDATPLTPNRFGILEPTSHHRQLSKPWALDLILMPLVAFDTTGTRLGMGGGFYDRTLAFMRQRQHWTGPRLIGLAHELQRVESLPRREWDIPLAGVITEKRIYRFNLESSVGEGKVCVCGGAGRRLHGWSR